MHYTQKWRLHHYPALSMAPPPRMHKTGLPQLRRHAFQPETPLLDNFLVQPGPCTPPPDPAQPPPDLTHPQHTRASPTRRPHVPVTGIPCWRSLSSFPAHQRAFHPSATPASPLRLTSSTMQPTRYPPCRTRLSHAGVMNRYHPLCVSLLQDAIELPPPLCGDVSVSGPRPLSVTSYSGTEFQFHSLTSPIIPLTIHFCI
jgi:hypothetical protein